MAVPRPRTASLAARIVALTLAIVTVTVTLGGLLGLAGVIGITQREEDSRLVAYRQLIVEDLVSRLTTGQRIVGSLVAVLEAGSFDEGRAVRALEKASAANPDYFDLLAVSTTTGTVLASVPGTRYAPPLPESVVATLSSGTDLTSFVWVPGGQGGGQMWVVHPVLEGKRPLALVARMRSGFTQLLVNDVASRSDRRAAVLLDGERVVAAGADGPPLDLSRAEFRSDTPSSSAGRLETSDDSEDGGMYGYWASLSKPTGLSWRVVVAEPRSIAFQRARVAVLPGVLTVIAVGIGAMWLASVFGRRLVEPLHRFEDSARAVASGRTVTPLEIDRDDEIGRLSDAFDAMLSQLSALRELSRLLARSNRMDEVLRGTLGAVVRLLGPDVVPAVFLLDESRGCLTLAATSLGEVPPSSVPADGASLPARALHSREPIAFHGGFETSAETPVMSAFEAAMIRSGVALPLVAADKPIGVLVAMSREEREYAAAEREILRAFAAQAALAIENSRLFEDERRSRREAEALREVAEILENPADLAVALERVAAIAADLLGAGCVSLALASPELGFATPSADFRAWDAVFSANADGAEPHEPIVVDAAVGFGPLRDARAPLMLVPLLQAGVRRGLLVLECEKEPAGFDEQQLAVAATVGREVSLALDNAYLLTKARVRAANLETIFRISQAVSSSLQSTVVLNRVLDVVQKIFSAEAVSLMTFDPVKRTIVTAMARGVPERDMLYLEVEPGEDLPGEVFATGTADVFPDLAMLQTPLARMAVRAGLHSLLAVPLLARGRSTGVLSVYSAEPEAFDAEDVELLQTFASQAALAIDTAQLYGREHRVSSVLQASILPEQLPCIDGLDVSSVYRPASREAEIGGDYYDLFETSDGRVLAAIADVAGKGVFAATKTSMIRYALRGLAAAGLGPAACVAELNRMVAESGDAADIVTIWVGAIDVEGRRLTYANAGHPPALLLQPKTAVVERLRPTGPVLGAVATAPYDEVEVSLDEGATLLLYTDGVTEARENGKFFGEGRVRRSLRSGGSAEVVAARLMTSVHRFSKNGLRDDAAVLVLQLSERE